MLPLRHNLSRVNPPRAPRLSPGVGSARAGAVLLFASLAGGAAASTLSAPATVGPGGIGLGVGGSAVAPFSQHPLTNSIDWIGHCASRGGAVEEGVDFEQHPIGDLVGDFYLCSHGVSMTAQAMTWVRRGAGAETGAVHDIVSSGEGVMAPSTYLLNGEPGSWSLTITFRRPVSGAGLMTADLYNPSGLNGLTLRAFAGAAASGALLAETTSPALCFQHNNRYFIGVTDDSARIRSIVLDSPNVCLDTVFLEYLAFSTPVSPSLLDGDVNGDAAIDDADMGALLAAWGDPGCIAADLDESGLVDGADLGILLSQIAVAAATPDAAPAPVGQAPAQLAAASSSVDAEAAATPADLGVPTAAQSSIVAVMSAAVVSAGAAPIAVSSPAQAAEVAYHATSSAASPALPPEGDPDAVDTAPSGRVVARRTRPMWLPWTALVPPQDQDKSADKPVEQAIRQDR